MKTFHIKIELGNDVMATGEHVNYALMECTHDLSTFGVLDKQWKKIIYDENGNVVGESWCEESSTFPEDWVCDICGHPECSGEHFGEGWQ